MIVVSDTSPLSALLKIKEAELLVQLFSRVVIPPAVRDELVRTHPRLPDWLEVLPLSDQSRAVRFMEVLDAGEAAAIALAGELSADRLLIDERKGRRIAKAEGLEVIGLVGVVLLARRKGLIASARQVMSRLTTEAKVWLSPELVDAALASVGE